MKPLVRLCSVNIENLKNVLNGTITMPHRLSGFNPAEGELLGIYGQNGTGKTTAVNALLIVFNLLRGEKLDIEAGNIITAEKNESTLSVLLNVQTSKSYDVLYEITIARNDSLVYIQHEAISVKENKLHARKSLIAEFIESERPTTEYFAPQTTLNSVLANCKKQDVLFHKMLAFQETRSYIFNNNMYEEFARLNGEYGEIMRAVRHFATYNFHVVCHWNASLVNINTQPIPVAHKDDDGESLGVYYVKLNSPAALQIPIYEDFKSNLCSVNEVLCKIIPNLTLEVRELGRELETAEMQRMRFELLSKRNGLLIPLKHESDGIKKIIAILLFWINVSNTPGSCLVVDELDASIFEYLLGELLSVWKNHSKGQLIFTAHNLHPLEMLDKRSVVFTTTDSHNRFIRLKNIKSCNNLRDVYLRTIFIGGQEYELYDETSQTEIARAIRKCSL